MGSKTKTTSAMTGAKINRAAERREEQRERAAAIVALGMLAEDGTLDGRYCATTSELVRWAKEKA